MSKEREIKFRAWLLVEERFIDIEYLYRSESGAVTTVVDNNGNHYEVGTTVVLMQYTGLKDKNGVEIYEGDVVGYRDGEWSFDAVVEWGDHGWYMRGIWPNDNFNFDDTEPRKLQVIGNIYQNPELLEAE